MLTRRRFVQAAGAGTAGLWIASRGREALAFGAPAEPLLDGPTSTIVIDSNENPVGPYAPVVDAVHQAFDRANRYPFATVSEVAALIASKRGAASANILLGTGSTQVLRSAIQVFTAKDRPLVEAAPTFETPGSYAQMIGTPIKSVPVTKAMGFDLDAMAEAAQGAGVVYLCNPNNPIPTASGGADLRAFIARVNRSSPSTTIVIDEAYCDYATMAGYESMIPVAIENPRVLVARTFSKAYAMAGLRLGYMVGHADTLKALSNWDGTGTVNVFALQAARAALTMDQSLLRAEIQRNADVRAFTIKWFADRGYTATDSQANFVFVDVKRPNASFRGACAKQNVRTGRDFAGFPNWSRITVGTMAEMRAATSVFEKVLAAPAVEHDALLE